jgi:hypothetical protein
LNKDALGISTLVLLLMLSLLRITAAGQTGVKISGDLRYRHQVIRELERPSRSMERFRARISFSTAVSENMDLVLGLASGPSDADPSTRNQSMTTGFSAKPVWFDFAYFNWRPVFIPKFSVSGGKMRMPFFTAEISELVWDNDVTPEGLHASFSPSIGKTGLRFDAGTFFVQERKGGVAAMLAAFGAGFRTGLFDDRFILRAGLGYYDFSGAKGNPTFFDSKDAFGNTVDKKDDYATDYNELEIGGELETRPLGFPVSVRGHAVKNTAVQCDARAWMMGLQLGKCEKILSWSVLYQYRYAEKDAVIGVFTDSEFTGGGTDNRGHMAKIHLQVGKGARLGTAFYAAEKDLVKQLFYRRIQADLTVKF